MEEQLALLRAERARIGSSRRAANTVTNYACDWRAFGAWCEGLGLASLPAAPETIELFATHRLCEARKVTSTRRACSAINYFHRQAGLPKPVTSELYELLNAAQRERGEKPRQMRALRVEDLRTISAGLRADGSPRALLQRAVLVLGFASALRRSSLAALALGDVEFVPEGLIVHVAREKQDQLGRGRLIGIPHGMHEDTCAPRCAACWAAVRRAGPGKFFRHPNGRPISGDWICELLQRHAMKLGLGADYGAHSLRAGFITAAGEAGLGELLIASQTGHRSMSMLRRYFRRTELFRANAAGMIGL